MLEGQPNEIKPGKSKQKKKGTISSLSFPLTLAELSETSKKPFMVKLPFWHSELAVNRR